MLNPTQCCAAANASSSPSLGFGKLGYSGREIQDKAFLVEEAYISKGGTVGGLLLPKVLFLVFHYISWIYLLFLQRVARD